MAEKSFRVLEEQGIAFEHIPSGIDTMTIYIHQDEFSQKEQPVIAGIHRIVNPDYMELETDLSLIAVVGRGMRSNRGTAARIFAALAHANVNVKMIDQGSSELNCDRWGKGTKILNRRSGQSMIFLWKLRSEMPQG